MNEDVDKIRQQFNIKLTELVSTKSDNNCYMSRKKYEEKLTMIKEIKNKTTGKSPTDYQRLKRYDIIKIGDDEKLVYPLPVCDAVNIIFRHYVCNEEIFDILHETHINIGHAGRNRMKLVLERNYKNITIEAIMMYLSLCQTCQRKLKIPKTKKPETIPPKTNNKSDLNRCQIDLIDMQDESDNGNKFILVYQDLGTKYIQLRPLKNRQPEDLVPVLLDIFTIFGTPCILQSDYSNKIVKLINSSWKDCNLVHAVPQPQKPLLQEISKMLQVWLKTNKTVNWSEGLRFVQLLKNRSYLEGLKMSPHEAVFGAPIRVGLRTSDEEDVENKTDGIKNEHEDFNENTEMWNVECASLCKVTMCG